MIPAQVAVALKAPLFCRFVGFKRGSGLRFGLQSQLVANPAWIRGNEACSFSRAPTYTLKFCSGSQPKESCHLELRNRPLGRENSRVLAVADGSSGGTGGYGGSDGTGGYGGSRGENTGGGDGKGSDGSSGGNKWSFLSWYLALLAKHPVTVKAVTSALLTCIGDLICQLVIEQVQSLDLKRTFMFTLLGLVLVGPTLHFWYLFLSKLVTLPGASGALMRLVLDQILFSPAFIGVFLATLVTLEGRPSQVAPKLEQEWFSSVIANWKLWIPFQFLNFRFVPQQFQVLAANVIALVWNVILSFKAHKEILPKDTDVGAAYVRKPHERSKKKRAKDVDKP